MTKTTILSILSFFSIIHVIAQIEYSKITQESYDNYTNTYNYTYWNNNWKTQNTGNSFSVLTSSFYLNIDYDSLNINSLLINNENIDTQEAFTALDEEVFDADYNATIDYAILQNGTVAYQKSNTPTSKGAADSQMAKYGVWYNTRFVSTNFTNSPPIVPYHTGIEFSNWHDRLQVVFHVKPTADITNGQLQFSFEIPDEYATLYTTDDGTFAFASPLDKGFVIKSGQNVAHITRDGNTITVTSAAQNLQTNTAYKVGLVVAPIKEQLSQNYSTVFDKDEPVGVTYYNTTSGSEITSTDWKFYDADEQIHYLKLPNTNMGYFNCGNQDVLYEQDIQLSNSTNVDKTVKLCLFKQSANVTGFNSLICNQNGDPSGIPLQVSKNWHTTKDQLFSGSWYYGYTEVVVPANTTINFKHRETAAKWGETYSASSHQLSVVGAGIPRGGWLEAALGTFGENITHSPDYEYGNSNGCDLRPFLVTNEAYGGTSRECGWTGNVGGIDMFVYKDASNTRRYQSQVKTQFKKYSPNLTETSISALSSDEKLKFDYTFYLNRSDDFTRVYYKVKLEALENASFSRFDLFQLGGDIYNIYKAQAVVYGNNDGAVASFTPNNNGSNDYTTNAIPLEGDDPWVWAGDGLYYTGAANYPDGIHIDTDNGMIIREYSASFAGVSNNIPYFKERSSSIGFSASNGNNPTSYCIVPPPSVTSFVAGDTMELLVEVAVLPKQQGDYYGPNEKFLDALASYAGTYDLLYRESNGNQIIASSPTNTVHTSYPLTVESENDTALVEITGGKGYVPVVFSGLTNISDPILWQSKGDGCWEIVDQSVNGKDFWQAEYVKESQDFNLIYNVNQDNDSDDAIQTSYYYLGAAPPEPSLIVQSLIVGESWSSNAEVTVALDSDSVTLAPQVRQHGINSVGIEENYVWTLPDEGSYVGRVLRVSPVTESDLGDYHVIYTDAYGCTDAVNYTISAEVLSTSTLESPDNQAHIYPNPVVDFLYSNTVLENIEVYDLSGSLLLSFQNTNRIDLTALLSGIYFAKITYRGNTYIRKLVKQ